MNRQAFTDFLVPTSSFLIGMGTAFNVRGNSFIYAISSSPAEADAKAISSDWKVTGEDLQEAVLASPGVAPQRVQK
jgi:hypothetical protein